MTDSRKFILIAAPRSASTSLRVHLNSYDDILCHGEILGRRQVIGSSQKLKSHMSVAERNSAPEEFLETYFPGQYPYEGFKALTRHFFQPATREFLDRYMAAEPKLFILWRRDLVAQISSIILHRVGQGYRGRLGFILKTRSRSHIKTLIDLQLQEFQRLFAEYDLENRDYEMITLENLAPLSDYFGRPIARDDIPRIQGGARRESETYIAAKRKLSAMLDHPMFDAYRDVSFESVMGAPAGAIA